MGDTCFRITATVDGEGVTELGDDVTICIEYSAADVDAAGGDPALLTIAYFDEDAGEWEVLPTTVDETEGIVCATVDHVSDWAVLGEGEVEEAGLAWWHILLIVLAAFVVLLLIIVLFSRRRAAQHRAYELEEMPEPE